MQIHRANIIGRAACGVAGMVRVSTSGVGVTCAACVEKTAPLSPAAAMEQIRAAAAKTPAADLPVVSSRTTTHEESCGGLTACSRRIAPTWSRAKSSIRPITCGSCLAVRAAAYGVQMETR